MRFIQKWSYCSANYVAKKMDENNEKRRVYYFGFQVVHGSIVKGALLVGVSLALGALIPALMLMAAFSSLRVIAGGYHMNTYGKCIATSMILFIVFAVVAQYTYDLWSSLAVYMLIAFVLALGTLIILRWAPSDTPNRPITEEKEIRKFKKLSLLYIGIFSVVNAVLSYYGLKLYSIAISFGALLELFTITPLGYKFFDAISGIGRDKKRQEEGRI